MKQNCKLRILISNNIYPAKEPYENEEGNGASWELRIEGHFLEDSKNKLHKVVIIVNVLYYKILFIPHYVLYCR